MKKIISIVALSFFSLIQAATYTDLADRKIIIKTPIKRVVALGPGALRLISYMKAQELVVGVEEMELKTPKGRPYWELSPTLHKLPSVAPGGPQFINQIPPLEKLIEVNPDVIFVIQMDKDLADKFQERIKIPVIVLSYGRFASFDPIIFKSLELLGKMLDRKERSDHLISLIQQEQNNLNTKTIDQSKNLKGCAYIGGIGFKGGHGIESTDSTYLPLEWIHAPNCAKKFKTEGHHFLTKEQILTLDPTYLFIDGNGNVLIKDDQTKNPAFYQSLSAIKNKNVFLLEPFNWYSTNVEIALYNGYVAGKALYPERFKEIDLTTQKELLYRKLLQ